MELQTKIVLEVYKRMNKLQYIDHLLQAAPSGDMLKDMQLIIETARREAHVAVNTILIERNWLLGRRIALEDLKGEDRAQYGASIIKGLSKELTAMYGAGFTKTNLYNYVDFYNSFRNIFHAVGGKSDLLLSWTHFRTLLQVKDSNNKYNDD